MKALSLAVSAAIVLCFCRPLHAEERSIAVSVAVTGDATNEISSFLLRELRELHDVRIVESGQPGYEINIVSVETSTGVRPNGYALSVLVTRRVDPDSWRFIVSTNELAAVQSLTKELCTVELHAEQVLPMEKLKSACQSLVARIDTIVFEENRKFAALVQDIIKTRKARENTNAPLDLQPVK